MAIALMLLALVLYLRTISDWTYTEYLTIVTTEGYDSVTTTNTLVVSPTGRVSPTKTNITTEQTSIRFSGCTTFNITVTDFSVGPNASVCTLDTYQLICSASITATIPTKTFKTNVWAAVTISNPSTCTQTSFTYTTSSMGILEYLYDPAQFPGIFSQAADTGRGY